MKKGHSMMVRIHSRVVRNKGRLSTGDRLSLMVYASREQLIESGNKLQKALQDHGVSAERSKELVSSIASVNGEPDRHLIERSRAAMRAILQKKQGSRRSIEKTFSSVVRIKRIFEVRYTQYLEEVFRNRQQEQVRIRQLEFFRRPSALIVRPDEFLRLMYGK
jgi:hypothetical protein